MKSKNELTHRNHQNNDKIKTKVQGRIAEGSGILQKLNKLHDVTAKIDNTRTREEILNLIRLEAKWLLNYDVCFTGILNQAKTHYIVNTLSLIADAGDLNHKHFSVEEGMPGWVIKNQASFIGDIETAPHFSFTLEGKIQELGIQSLLVVHMKTGNESIGALVFGRIKQGLFSEEDTAIAQLLSLYLATALKDASIFEDARKRIAQIELINKLSNQLASMLQLETLLNTSALTIQKTFNYFDVTIFLLNDEKTEIELVAHSGNFIDFLPHGYRQSMDKGIVGWVARNGEKILCNDVLQDPRYHTYEYHNTRSELAVPITVENQVVGVLNVEDTKLHAFDETDTVVLGTLSDQLGIAIKNAKLYEEIQQANLKLTELDKMKSEFLGIVFHDFRSPLSSVMLAGKALLKNEIVQSQPRVKEYLQIIVDQANRLNQLAEDTLSITKIESGQLNYFFKIVNIERLIQDAIAMVRISSRHKIAYKIDPNVAFIKGDQTKLRQVVQNLVSNAVKYSPRGGTVNIIIEDLSPEMLSVSVSDEGIGIPKEHIGNLFRKFSRVNTGEAKDIKGAGLGLWICKEVVEAHGGKIWVESEGGKGTTMKFTLKKAQ
ncbi:MAG: ATP-binding protein [Bacteroidota bacterium]|nr:ATP-binding protein [Bacteroidota bacterium]